MPSRPYFPLTDKPMTRREADDLLNCLAALVESYPSDKVLLTVNVEVPTTAENSRSKASSSQEAPEPPKRSGRTSRKKYT